MENSFLGAKNNSSYVPPRIGDGKIPPQDLNAERAVLGSCVFGRKFFDRAETVITSPEMFYKEGHKLMWTAMSNIQGPIDIDLLKARLEKEGNLEAAGGLFGLMELYDGTFNSENVEYYAAVVREMWLRRRNIMVARELEARSYDYTADVFDSMDLAEKGIQDMSGSGSGLVNAMEAYLGTVIPNMEAAVSRRMEAEKSGKAMLTGVPSGLECMDRETGGFADTDFVVIAARPAMGKTHMALGIARTAALFQIPTAFFSLEMDGSQLIQRMISYDSEVNTRDMRQGNIGGEDWNRMNMAAPPLDWIWIDDTGSVTVSYIRARARAFKKKAMADWKKKNPRKKESEFKMLILIDFLQLMSGGEKSRNGTREQEISGIARGLKSLAKELRCPVIALSQLSRAVETRGGDKRPILSDLKESGDIEAAADLVMLLYRAEYYGLMEFSDGSSTKDVGEIIVAKYRHGRTGDYKTEFTGRGGWRNPGDRPSNQLRLPTIQPKVFSEASHSDEQPYVPAF